MVKLLKLTQFSPAKQNSILKKSKWKEPHLSVWNLTLFSLKYKHPIFDLKTSVSGKKYDL